MILLVFAILVSSKVAFTTSNCVPDANPYLQYAQYDDDCLPGGYERFILQYKRKNTLNANQAIKTFQCRLCDPEKYLDCYLESGLDPKVEDGKCKCISSHTKGYILIYDNSATACRGHEGSVSPFEFGKTKKNFFS